MSERACVQSPELTPRHRGRGEQPEPGQGGHRAKGRGNVNG